MDDLIAAESAEWWDSLLAAVDAETAEPVYRADCGDDGTCRECGAPCGSTHHHDCPRSRAVVTQDARKEEYRYEGLRDELIEIATTLEDLADALGKEDRRSLIPRKLYAQVDELQRLIRSVPVHAKGGKEREDL